MGTSYAVGTIRGNVLLLAPLDGALQLRPSLVHLDEKGVADKRATGAASAAAEEAAGGDMEDDDEKAGVMQQVNVRTADCCLDRRVVADLAQYHHTITDHIIGCFTTVQNIDWGFIYHFVSVIILMINQWIQSLESINIVLPTLPCRFLSRLKLTSAKHVPPSTPSAHIPHADTLNCIGYISSA